MEDLSIQDINLIEWHSNREVECAPKHFVRAKAPVTPESTAWIKNNLVGRYCIVFNTGMSSVRTVAFEDPSEATFYELTWS